MKVQRRSTCVGLDRWQEAPSGVILSATPVRLGPKDLSYSRNAFRPATAGWTSLGMTWLRRECRRHACRVILPGKMQSLTDTRRMCALLFFACIRAIREPFKLLPSCTRKKNREENRFSSRVEFGLWLRSIRNRESSEGR
jgi:hypothetical protein